MVLLLRHKDQIIRARTSPTCECDGQFTQRESLCTRGFGFPQCSLRHFAAPSVPLFSTGPGCWRPCTGPGGQGCFYGEVARVLDWPSSAASSARTGWHQPVGGSGIEALFGAQSKPWLSATSSIRCVARINISMIVCRPKRCRRSTTGWCPRNLSENPLPH